MNFFRTLSAPAQLTAEAAVPASSGSSFPSTSVQPPSDNTAKGRERDESEAWRKRIQRLQSERCTPEVRRRLSDQAYRARRLHSGIAQSRRLETATFLSSVSNVMSIQSLSMANGSRGRDGQYLPDYEGSTTRTLQRNSRIQVYLYPIYPICHICPIYPIYPIYLIYPKTPKPHGVGETSVKRISLRRIRCQLNFKVHLADHTPLL